jgi:hypothetical protein
MLYIPIVLIVILFFYLIFLAYHRTVHIYKTFKNKELDIRNSPLNHIAGNVGKILFCIKGVCDWIPAFGLGLGMGAGIDQILEHSGRDEILLFYLEEVIIWIK